MGNNHNHVLNLGGKGASIEALIAPLRLYEATWRAFGLAEQVVTNYLGVPICKSNCGKCCEVTTVTAWDVETHFIVSWLLGQEQQKRDELLSICEGWLLDHNPALFTYGMSGVLNEDQWRKLKPEVDFLTYCSSCPMLTGDKQCLIHDAAPLVCRAYGVTRMPGLICPRPLSKLESPDARGHIAENHPLGQQLRRMVAKTLYESTRVGWDNARFLSTAIFQIMRPQKFNAYISDGRIASAKLAMVNNTGAILFQSELNEAWARELATPKEV